MKAEDLIIQHFPRLKPDQRKALTKLGLSTISDLLYHFPARYEAAGPSGTISGVSAGADVTLYGTVRKPAARKAWKSRKPVGEAWLEDASGKIKMMWFGQPYIAKMLADGMVVKATGKIAGTGANKYLANPEIDKSPVPPDGIHDTLFAKGDTAVLSDDTLYAIYPESKGISSLWLLHAARKVFEAGVQNAIQDPIPAEILERYNLPILSSALVWMHVPRKLSDAQAARKRFAFEEVLALQLTSQMLRRQASQEKALPIDANENSLGEFVSSFPFPPTGAQLRTIEQVRVDFERGQPMRRLLEGDVGSGKTAVAASTAYMVATSSPPGRKSGTLQVAYMCPTEILAKQHFSTFV